MYVGCLKFLFKSFLIVFICIIIPLLSSVVIGHSKYSEFCFLFLLSQAQSLCTALCYLCFEQNLVFLSDNVRTISTFSSLLYCGDGATYQAQELHVAPHDNSVRSSCSSLCYGCLPHNAFAVHAYDFSVYILCCLKWVAYLSDWDESVEGTARGWQVFSLGCWEMC